MSGVLPGLGEGREGEKGGREGVGGREEGRKGKVGKREGKEGGREGRGEGSKGDFGPAPCSPHGLACVRWKMLLAQFGG